MCGCLETAFFRRANFKFHIQLSYKHTLMWAKWQHWVLIQHCPSTVYILQSFYSYLSISLQLHLPSLCSENTYETVEPKESAALSDHVAMETNPAYASVNMTATKSWTIRNLWLCACVCWCVLQFIDLNKADYKNWPCQVTIYIMLTATVH